MLLRSSKSAILGYNLSNAMAHFPKTQTAYQLVTEYCTIHRVRMYEDFHFHKKVNPDEIYWATFKALNPMYDEILEVAASEYKFRKKDLLKLLQSYLVEEKIKRFKTSAATLIDAYNETYPDRKIFTGNVLTEYFKDGYNIVCSFRDMITECIEQYWPNDKTDSTKEPAEEKTPSETDLIERLRVDLTAKQLLYLFKSLKDRGIIKNTNPTDICKVVSLGFQLANSSDTKQLSVKHLQNTWSQLDAQVAKHWFEEFLELSKQAKLDNPNNLKGKK